MATSITASNSSSPFNGYLLTDASYVATNAFSQSGAVTPSINFKTSTPFPTLNYTDVYVYSTILTGATGSVSLYAQESADNVNWANSVNLPAPLLSPTASVAVNTTINLQPQAKQYFRLSSSVAAGNPPITGSFGTAILF